MATRTFWAGTMEYLRVGLIRDEFRRNGDLVDPTGLDVHLAVVPAGDRPEAGDWQAAAWENVGEKPYIARLLVSEEGGFWPTGGGTAQVWLRITDVPEVPVVPVGLARFEE